MRSPGSAKAESFTFAGTYQEVETAKGDDAMVAIGGIDLAVPKLCAKTQPTSQVKDDVGVGAGLSRWRDNRLPKLNVRLCVLAYLESNLQGFALEA